MTEEEMKTKWCPHAIVNCGEGYSGNRKYNKDKTSGFFSLCLGSACSQWRWKKVANPKWNPAQYQIYPMPNPYSQEPSGIDSDKHGYCGLAGQP